MCGAKEPYEKHKNDGTYLKYLSEDSKFTEQIDLDVNRSYRNHIQFKGEHLFIFLSFFNMYTYIYIYIFFFVFEKTERFGVGQITLFNILKAYSNYDKEVGYCQGMSDLTAFFLMYIPEEVKIYFFFFFILFLNIILYPIFFW